MPALAGFFINTNVTPHAGNRFLYEQNQMEETFTCETAAKYCKCGVQTIRDAIQNGELAAAKIGKGYVIRRARLDEYISNKEELTAQAVRNDRNQTCCLNTPMASGTLISKQKVEKELDARLKPKMKNLRRNTTINSSTNYGDKNG
ncbi:excisionase family DNA-binding protein [Snodgrassella alvi]|uniref:excisionase family DNA-binding protein n=1 Tax=Snodgrassella alvi TaxID=1196083 RepID=UPI000C1E83D5